MKTKEEIEEEIDLLYERLGREVYQYKFDPTAAENNEIDFIKGQIKALTWIL
jgi:hypothetical protein